MAEHSHYSLYLRLSGDRSLNWEHFEETFIIYAVLLMGYRTADAAEPTKELAALTYALPKQKSMLKTPYHGGELTTRMTQHTKLKYFYFYICFHKMAAGGHFG